MHASASCEANGSPRERGGIGSVRDFHTKLEERAIAGATMGDGHLSMTAVATLIATAGLLLDGAAAVIRAVCMAPFGFRSPKVLRAGGGSTLTTLIEGNRSARFEFGQHPEVEFIGTRHSIGGHGELPVLARDAMHRA